MQVASQQTQSPVGPGTYAVDSSLASRRQYSQQASQAGDQSQSHSQPRSSPHSSRRPSRRPSGNGNSTLEPDASQQTPNQSSMGTHHSNSSTPRGQDMASATHASPMIPTISSSPPYQQSRRDQRGQQSQQSGPPISPPPRTSSNQRGQSVGLPSTASLADRTASSRQPALAVEERQPTSRSATVDSLSGGEPGVENDAAAVAANAARSRRRGPTSPEGPQRAISTREPGSQQSPTTGESRSASNVASATPHTRPGRDESQIINRVIVDDPAVDLKREQERQLESVPGLAVVNNVTAEDVSRAAPRSRQDHSAGAGNTGRRKETRFGDYILGQTLGEGEFGKVKLGWKKNGEVQVAIKLIRRESLGQNPSRLPKIYREVSILRGLEHPNIVKLHEMIETPPYIGIILEYASGGELFDYILNHRYLKDNTARKLFAQLVSGVGYLHKKGIVHRDLKLENLLLDRNRNIVITDFGFANTFDPRDELGEDIEKKLTDREFVRRMDLERVQNGSRRGDLMATSCGSPCYAAPELVVTDSLYTGRKVDVWSCGVILVRQISQLQVNVQSNPCFKYAMLAGYLPFDDDPANPEGDNINLLYRYITTTALTFPEYVTPHARDLLRRILVADPRQRADLFEVARHSWLSDFAHVVAQVTSSTTTVGEIANTTVTAGKATPSTSCFAFTFTLETDLLPVKSKLTLSSLDPQDAPLLVRSASVREPAKTHPSNMSPVGALSHQGKFDPEQAIEKSKAPRDPKRRTVQVEYVAPQSQTVRGEGLPLISSPATDVSSQAASTGQQKTRARAGNEGPEPVPRQYNTTTKPSPQDVTVTPASRSSQAYQQGANRTQYRPSSSQRDMAPPSRPPKDLPRSVSEYSGAFGPLPTSTATRPTTGGSMASTAGRLPSRGNSYSQPLAPTVAPTNAEGRLAQPKSGKQYNISAPIAQSGPYGQNETIGLPSTQQYDPPTLGDHRDQSRGHKRSNTLGNFFRTGSISGGRSQPQSPGEAQREKRYPPTSMKTPIVSDSPRQSTDSRRPSISFGRKSSDLRKNSDLPKMEKPRRFSLLPASFSLKSFTSTASGKDTNNEMRPASERRQSSNVQPGLSSRAQSRPQTMAYNRGQTGANSYGQEENLPAGYDGSRDRSKNSPAQQTRRKDVPSRAEQQDEYGNAQTETSQDPYLGPKTLQPGQSYLDTPTESQISINHRRERPVYPQGFNEYEEPASTSVHPSRSGRGPNVLQKNNRKFADAYEQDADPSYGVGGHHAGTSGAARRVMDFFRRRGKARAGEERV